MDRPQIISLRPVISADLPILFKQQANKTAIHQAAFTFEDPYNRRQFISHWQKILLNESIQARVILYKQAIAGHIEFFSLFGKPSVGYWLGEPFWGKGIASEALKLFLQEIPNRPVFARVAWDNQASIRVLEKNGFIRYGRDQGYAHGRGCEVTEFLYKLDLI